MLRHVCNRQGHWITPLRAILFFATMLVFIFTVVYRMAKSDSISAALATLVESLLMVAFFIFVGIVSAYLIYCIHDKIRQGSSRRQIYHMLGDPSAGDESAGKPERDEIGLEPGEKVESQPNS